MDWTATCDSPTLTLADCAARSPVSTTVTSRTTTSTFRRLSRLLLLLSGWGTSGDYAVESYCASVLSTEPQVTALPHWRLQHRRESHTERRWPAREITAITASGAERGKRQPAATPP